MPHILRKCLLLPLITLAVAFGSRGAVPLAKSGQLLAEIVTSADAAPPVKFVADGLQHWIDAISGAADAGRP